MLEEVYNTVVGAAAVYLDPRERLSIHWQLAALGVALAYYRIVVYRSQASGPAGLLRWLLPKGVIFHPSAVTDYIYFVVNRLLRAFVYLQVFALVPIFTALAFTALTETFGIPAWDRAPSIWWSVLVTLVMVLVLDFALWFMHWLFHVVPELWEFHKVHHSAEVLTPITAGRMHPVEEIFDSVVASAALGGTYAIMAYLLGPATIELTLFEINVVIIAFYVAAFNLRHSHVFLRYPYWLQHVFVSPAQHQIHHSRAPEHWNRNMGFIFAFWDWAAGTLVSPKRHMRLEFGLGTAEDGTWHGVGTLYLRPFRGAWMRLRDRARRSQPGPHAGE